MLSAGAVRDDRSDDRPGVEARGDRLGDHGVRVERQVGAVLLRRAEGTKTNGAEGTSGHARVSSRRIRSAT